MSNNLGGSAAYGLSAVSTDNFEQWLRMATDNKINTVNTWNVELIDYFHDFNILKDGDTVNFAKASATLDGCMKIYAHRIDSAANDTGILITSINMNSAHKDKRDKKNGGILDEDEDDEDEDEYEDENENSKKKKKSTIKVKSNFVTSFETIRIRDADRPFKPDPVFKKALTDFDEGGTKGLLNNILRISKDSKMVFDISNADVTPDTMNTNHNNSSSVSLEDLKKFLTFDLIGDDFNVCPSLSDLNQIAKGRMDPNSLIEKIDEIEITVAEDSTTVKNSNGSINQSNMALNKSFDADGDVNLPDFEPEFDFEPDFAVDNSNIMNSDGPVGESSAVEATETNKRTPYSIFIDGVEGTDEEQSGPNVTLNRLFGEVSTHTTNSPANDEGDEFTYEKKYGEKLSAHDLSLMNMYDEIGSRPSTYWKISRMKKRFQAAATAKNERLDADDQFNTQPSVQAASSVPNKTKKKKKEFLVDFMNDDNDLEYEELFKTPQPLNKILISTKEIQERKKRTHLLDDGFPKLTAKTLAFLSLKPKQLINTVLLSQRKNTHEENENDNIIAADENYFADNYQKADEILAASDNNNILDDMNDDFDIPPDFDFDPNGVEGFDEPVTQTQTQTQSQHQLYKSNQINYSRRSKKVDIKLLKHNIWESIEEITIKQKKRPASRFDMDETKPEPETNDKDSTEDVSNNSSDVKKEMNFTSVVKVMSSKYNNTTKNDLSTSFCFICLLHLANENGLTLENLENYEDIIIHK